MCVCVSVCVCAVSGGEPGADKVGLLAGDREREGLEDGLKDRDLKMFTGQ